MGKSKLPFLGQSGIASADASRVPHIQAKKEQVRSRSQEIGWLLWALQYVFLSAWRCLSLSAAGAKSWRRCARDAWTFIKPPVPGVFMSLQLRNRRCPRVHH